MTRYLVATGTWDGSNTAIWSATSGGAAGASVPTSTEVVILDAASGAVTVTLGGGVTVGSLNMGGFTGTLAFGIYKISLTLNNVAVFVGSTTCTITGTTPLIELTYSGSVGTRNISITSATAANSIAFAVTGGTDTVIGGAYTRGFNFTGFSGTLTNVARDVFGSVTFSPTMTLSSGTLTMAFRATSGTQVITSNGVTLDFPVTVNAPGATVQLADALTMGSTRALALTDGGFNANGFNVTAGTVAAGASFDTLTMGAGTWTIQGSGASAWSINAAVTVVPGTSTVSMTSASAKTFAGAGKTYYNLSQGGAGALSITGANTFNDLQNTVTPATITLPASTTTTVSALSLAGTAGNLVTLNSSTPATRATLSKASGTVDASNATIKDIAATGGATWNAFVENNNINAGNNTGWDFGQGPAYDIEFSPALRSFTERKHF